MTEVSPKGLQMSSPDQWADWALEPTALEPTALEPTALEPTDRRVAREAVIDVTELVRSEVPNVVHRDITSPTVSLDPSSAPSMWSANFEPESPEAIEHQPLVVPPRKPRIVDIVEDFTDEFADIEAGNWDDEPFRYLDDQPLPGLPVLPTKPSAKPVAKSGAQLGAKSGVQPAAKSAAQAKLATKSVSAVRPRRRHGRIKKVAIGLVTVVSLLIGYVTWQFATIRRNEVAQTDLDLPGSPVRKPPPQDLQPDQLPTTVATLETIPFNEPTPNPDAPAVTVAPGQPVSTIPGEGSCEDDPACANAPEVKLPEAEKPREGGLLVDPVQATPIGGDGASNILLIGSDSRADLADDQRTGFGTVGGNRSDTIIVMRISTDGKSAALLSLPRDTYVHIAGTKQNDRINSAYAKGLKTLVRTIQENFNIPIHHVAEVDFAGFQKIVGSLGGVEICFDFPARDKVTKLNVAQAGCQLLNQTQATAYVRSRHYEQLVKGNWVSDGRGDIGRVQRQQRFIKQVMQKAIDSGGRNPITAQALIGDLKSAVSLDNGWGITELYGTAKTFSAFEPNQLQGFTLPTSSARIDGKAVLRVDRAKASQLVAKFGTRTPAS
jgi:LCP family protein required for cell wall assembly